MRLEILLTVILFFGGTCLTGYALCYVLKLKNEGLLFSIVSGTVLWWAILELLLVPMTMSMVSFNCLIYIYTAIVLILSVLGCFCWKSLLEDFWKLVKNVKMYLTLGHIIALGLIIYQLYFIHHHMYLEWDDTYYVNLANEALNSNKIYWVYPETGAVADFAKRYVLSLWPIFYAWLSVIVKVTPTVMAHTILPWLIVPLAYMVYSLIGKKAFPNDYQLQGMFLALVVMLHLFMSGEHVAGLTFLSITPWVGKGVLATVFVPLLFYLIFRTVDGSRVSDWVLLGIACLGGCLLSSMGIMLTPVFIGVAVFLVSIYKKSIPYLFCGMAACIPCIILGMYYIYLKY